MKIVNIIIGILFYGFMDQFTLHREQQRLLLLYDYRSGLNSGQLQLRINQAFGDTIGRRTAYDWFSKFNQGLDQPRSGRPSPIDDEKLLACVEADPHLTSRDLAEKFGVSSHSTILDHLRKLGKVSKLDKWVPHLLTDYDRQRRTDACMTLLSRKRNRYNWLNNIVTADEKWCVYNNTQRRRSWTNVGSNAQPHPKANPHQKKLMVCVWWDVIGVIHWEMLERNQTIDTNLYCQQLQ
jgi:histone-lysine N-methyltransferase SETMAR